MRLPRSLTIALLALSSPLAWGLSSDRDQPMHLEADHADINDKTGVHIYTGNVVITQGTLHMTGDHLTVYTVEGEIKKAISLGKPATYRQRPDNKDQDVEAEALRMEYYADEGKLILIDTAKVWQGGDTFRSERITYDIDRDVVNAGTGEDRVRIILQPRNKAE